MFQDNSYYVYFIREIEQIGKPSEFFKIGYSKNPIKRQKQLQVGHPKPLGIFGLIRCPSEDSARKMEKKYHFYFRKERAHGEWFSWCAQAESIFKEGLRTEPGYIRFFG